LDTYYIYRLGKDSQYKGVGGQGIPNPPE